MPTPAIQTLINDAQQVLNLDSISAVRSVVAVSLANANTGTPLNPNLTTQQLWNEFYQVVTRSKSDIESIIANQLMKFLYSPPAPGGVGANKQVIFNDGGVLAGDPQFLWDKTTNLLTVTGAATISGDLTVDTNVLKVDTTNNRVGVNTASPATDLEVRSIAFTEGTIRLYSAIDGSNASPKGSYFSFRSGTTGGGTETARLSSLNRFSNVSGGDFSISTADTSSVMQNRLTIDSGGVFTFAVGGSTAMTLNATGLGVGVSPGYKLDVAGSSAGVLRLVNINNLSTDPAAVTRLSIDGQGATWHLDNERTNGIFKITRNSTACLTIDNSANVGIGVVPSAWNNTYNVLDIGQNGSISGRTSTNNSVDIVSNGFRNAGGTWVYKLATSNAASRYLIDGATGGHLWYSGAAGTAGNTIAGFSTATMTLDSSGRLILLASTTTPATLSTNGQLTFTATSDTNLRFSYRGSDGVTRVANITLA